MIYEQQRAPLSEYAQSSKPISNTGCMIGLIILTLPLPIFAVSPIMSSAYSNPANQSPDPTLLIIAAIVFLVVLILPSWLIWITVRGSYLVKRATKPWLDRNDLDFAMSKTVQAQITALLSSPQFTANPSEPDIRVCQNLRLGEMSRHFDSMTKANIAGWLDHQLGINGWGAGLQVGNVGLGVGKVDITGQSQASFVLSGTTRDNLLGDGFVAVLEQDGYGSLVDTIRVVVPSEPAIREFIGQFMDRQSILFYKTSHCGNVFSANTTLIQQLVNVSYVSDRLSAVLRMPPERRPRVSVIGAKNTEHAIIGDMIWIENDRSYYLFPIHLLTEINKIAIQARTRVDFPDPTASRTGVARVESRGWM